MVPVVNHILRRGTGRGIQAFIVYPMNALVNSQCGELKKFVQFGYPENQPAVRFAAYTGQERDEQRDAILKSPPDILITNYVMLELILTRPIELPLIAAARGLRSRDGRTPHLSGTTRGRCRPPDPAGARPDRPVRPSMRRLFRYPGWGRNLRRAKNRSCQGSVEGFWRPGSPRERDC